MSGMFPWGKGKIPGKREHCPTGTDLLKRAFLKVLRAGANPFCAYFRVWVESSLVKRVPGRQRVFCIFAAAEAWDFDLDDCLGVATSTLLLLLNGCIAALNFLAADFCFARAMGTHTGHTKAQRPVLKHMAGRVVRFLAEMQKHVDQKAQTPAALSSNM